jgi:hypothetical protein
VVCIFLSIAWAAWQTQGRWKSHLAFVEDDGYSHEPDVHRSAHQGQKVRVIIDIKLARRKEGMR